MNPLKRAAGMALFLMLAGCAMGPQVVPAGPQTYTVSAVDGLGWASAREVVFSTANRYCVKRKLVMVPVSLDVRPGELGERLTTADLVFRALRPGDPEIARTEAVFRHHDPLIVHESVLKYTESTASPTPPPKRRR